MHDQPCRQSAALAGEDADGPLHGARAGGVDIAIGEQQAGGFAAEFQHRRFQLFSTRHKNFARGDGAGQNAEHTIGDTGLARQAGEQVRREGGDFRGLYHHAIAGGQGRGDFHAQRNERAVPGDDNADDTQRFGHGVGEFIARIEGGKQLALQLVGPAGVIGGPFSGEHGAVHAQHKRRAAIERGEAGKFLGVLSDQLCESQQHFTPCFGLPAAPGLEGGDGLGHGFIHFRSTRERDCGLHGAGDGVSVLEYAAGAGLALLRADLQFCNELLHEVYSLFLKVIGNG